MRRSSRWKFVWVIASMTFTLVALGAVFGVWVKRRGGLAAAIGSMSRTLGDRAVAMSSRIEKVRKAPEVQGPRVATTAADPRLAALRRAAEGWNVEMGPRRRVVDQVCLVSDVPTFLEAIAAWDDRRFFPILIDDPAWTLPFLRAFRPARVVRYVARPDASRLSRLRPGGASSAEQRLELWTTAIRAVSRGWSDPSVADADLPPGGRRPRGLGPTPPGVVLSSPESPMLAGAVALAAGRFEPLARLEPALWGLGEPGDGLSLRYPDVLTLPVAWRFARRLENEVAALVHDHGRIGDDCDFLTIAGDWPYRYDNKVEPWPAQGIQALDDLIGRTLEGQPDARGLQHSRHRWAFTGRLMGDPAASVARAMAALFLVQEAALFWDTYRGGDPWSAYALPAAAARLGRAGLLPRVAGLASGPAAGLDAWHRATEPPNRFGLIWINTSGSPTEFSIPGGPGWPADLPGVWPASVVMIHSFSAADPSDPGTLAGRWLAQGAFSYFGSVHEPYLMSFRPPALVAELAALGVPLAAALRQGEDEPFGRPWRLVYLGDPLYRIPPASGVGPRLPPRDWRALSPDYDAWPAPAIVLPADPAFDDPAERLLEWCGDAAILETVATPGDEGSPSPRDWRPVLLRIDRDRLAPSRRPIHDILLIDALGGSGEWEELQTRLARIPPHESGPRAWIAQETGAMARLSRMSRDPKPERGFLRALDLWDLVMRLGWPSGSAFPARFTERMARVVESDPARRLPAWRDRLTRAAGDMSQSPGRFAHLAVVNAERARVVTRLGSGG